MASVNCNRTWTLMTAGMHFLDILGYNDHPVRVPTLWHRDMLLGWNAPVKLQFTFSLLLILCVVFLSVFCLQPSKKKNIESITARTIMGPIGTNCTSNRYSAVSDGSNWTSRDILAVEQQERDYVPKCFDRTFFRALFIMWGFSVRTCLSISICHKERAVQGA